MTWRCPICGRPTDSETDPDFPFCSSRHRLIDLGQWAAEEDKISEPAPAAEAPDSELHDHDPRDA